MSTYTGESQEEAQEVDEVEARIGLKVGTYVLTKRLGHGGMGAVYAAEHPSIGSKVAIKFLHRKYAADPAIVERFFNEARAVNLIGHENLVKVSDLDFASDGSPYFIMEFLEGRPLSAMAGTPQPLEEMGPIFLQACDGLAAAHEKGIIHRDLKPDNLFLVSRHRRANVVKIVDFGIAKLQGGSAGGARTSTGMILGTAHYMSPEQAGGEVNKIGPQSDIYAMGVIMFQLATGRFPFDGANLGQILVGHLTKPAPDPREYEASVPDDYAAVILKCLEKNIEDRYPSMHALYEAIAAVLDAHGFAHEPPAAKGLTPSSGGQPGPISRPAFSTPTPRPQTSPPHARSNPPRPMTPAPRPASNPAVSGSNPGTDILPRSNPGTEMMNPTDGRAGHTVLNPGASRPASIPPTEGVHGTAVVPPAYAPLAAAPPPKSKGGLVAGVVVVLAFVAGAAGWVLTRPKAGAEPTPVAIAPVVPSTVKLTVDSTPPDAKVTVTQAGNSSRILTPGSLPVKPGEPVSLHGELPGHSPVDRTLTLNADETVFFVFEAVDPAPAPAPVVAAPPTPGPSAPAPAPKPVVAPAKKKDVGDGVQEVEL